MTVTDEYADAPTWERVHADYLSPGQDAPATMANVLRSAALELAPEGGDVRSDIAIYAALDKFRALLLRPGFRDFPETRAMLLKQLWDVAGELKLNWYGHR